jgi:hypothetical protein
MFIDSLLAGTTFYPDDPQVYLTSLAIPGLSYGDGTPVRLDSTTTLHAFDNWLGRASKSIVWRDSRL